MAQNGLFFRDLTTSDIEEIKSLATNNEFSAGEVIFAEGDEADSFYIIEQGRVAVYYEEKGEKNRLCTLGDSDYFGEMAIYNRDRRCASVEAMEHSRLLRIEQQDFIDFIERHPRLAEIIQNNLQQRNEELLLRENLIDLTGVSGKRLHVSIKGDPSMRESAFARERYESVVDKVLGELQPAIEELLLRRCVYSLFINFNSGEIRVSSVFNPFVEELHTADKLVNSAYIDRHFPTISYADKSAVIRSTYACLSASPYFAQLPGHLKNVLSKSYQQWQPVPEGEISRVISQLTKLRSIQNFYLRNFGFSMILDAIRMQFNCDGTHIVSAVDYQQFLEENLEQN
jgi:CRP-like cAMP-binding protein